MENQTKIEQMQEALARKLLAATVTARPGKVDRRSLVHGPGSNVTSKHWGLPVG